MARKKTVKPKSHKLPLLFLLGLLIFSLGFYTRFKSTILSFRYVPPALSNQASNPLPVTLEVPRLNIDLPVVETHIIKGVWIIPERELGHLAISASPGEGGNIVVYGHNEKVVLGSLFGIKKGDLILLTSETDTRHTYVVQDILTVTPDRIDLVSPTSTEVLTVYTCTGLLDSQRFIVRATPKTNGI